ncbi:sugar-transfer associated ATP-grasp domain-containing protein [Lacicoccus alkaliphilus]|uniref:Sugar-transfer associated ATP-grasp n=1 Tax=Lacicoccus alkaliphilus DSM 16010 TaxID=1123231 RepID=A0A1M7CUR7_9BACL|nr:sugar-transfer associated ATP-grasp domain-containing protein [Salinicoccus alkaliphilus]SHL70907.1 Sugar-transfer associated ATP-grasp [Salinicoccus alkaliphilus DSM 16010]
MKKRENYIILRRYVRFFTRGAMNVINSLYLVKIFAGEVYNIIHKRNLYKDVELSDQQKRSIHHLWQKNLGLKIPVLWHRLYQSYTGKFNKNYFPEIFVTMKLEPKLNDREIGNIISDKSLLPLFYRDVEGVRLPETYIMNNSGIFYTPDREIITRDEALERLADIGGCVVKATLDTSSGDSIRLCNFKDGKDRKSGRPIEEVLNSYGENFIVQEKIVPHHKLTELYPGSVNTFRVITYLLEDRIEHGPVTLSMGREGHHVDNIQAGGISIAVSDDGKLYKEGFTHYKEVHQAHPDTGAVFGEYHLPKVRDIIAVTKKMHEKTPHMKIISWDVTLDENNDIVLLEFNVNGMTVWFPQMVSGRSVFGDDTEKMIRMLKE